MSLKKSKEVWDVVNHISNLPKNTSDMNNYFTTLVSNLCGNENDPLSKSEIQLLNRVPDSKAFTINYITYDEVQKIILNYRNECFCGHNSIPVKFLKPVVEQITSPIVHIINTSIDKEIVLDIWKVASVCPIAEIDIPVTEKDLTNIYFTFFIQSIQSR